MIYLKIDSIKGNCTDDGFKEQIMVDSFQHGLSLALTNHGKNSDRTAGGPSFSEMSFSKVMDSSTPLLYAACAGARPLKTAVVTVTRDENDKHMTTVVYNLGEAMISSISTSGSSGGMPHESFSIHFTTITSQVTQQNTDSTKKGVAPFGWDLKKDIPLAPPA
jgi:type VI secretion system secreted protein Hcp